VNDVRVTNRRPVIKRVASLLIAAGVIFFFWRAFRSSWASLSAHHFRLSYPFVALSFLGVIASSLFATYAWQLTINSLSRDNKMTFSHSVATVNTTSLTKYLPGKFWSYALQMYWLTEHGYAKSLVLYVNIVNLAVSMVTGVMLSLGFLVFADRFALSLTIPALALWVLIDLVCLAFHDRLFEGFVTLVNRYFKRRIASYSIELKTMLRLHAVHLLGQLISAIGAYLLCFGIGYELDLRTIMLVMSALILSDAVGFVVFFVPGGLGVREATMYLILGGAAAGSLALVLPLASRMVGLLADGVLGAIALKLLRASVRPELLAHNKRDHDQQGE
jgi:uncharacterized membrane protein YbhN (UPF0104 family)